ncbi:2-C-methyl-D-erythritol 4-phosphate cytidylyltransferase [Mucilaginibacter ginkgonis]|uniref:2-C-methyl-D-erythritol 4-phosphate cytidylyltransferase n=1 Tax=Mucilaginibacter ginkgonis TaxID=2682091 RepID=UPI001FC8BDD7|nr:2-C-methyl-D-erythritol 4-phosphate cytidylyltransferase [Mucilaginibacter ginkgonis]
MTSHISNLTSQISYYAIIVAGGSGSRMRSDVPKQFLLLNGLPVMMHTIQAFAQSTFRPKIILALPRQFHGYWKDLCDEYNFDLTHEIVAGGETRFHSVKNALQLITDSDALVAIQDAVRPLTPVAVIDEAYKVAAQTGAAVAAVQSRDSIRQMHNGVSKNLRRDEIYLVQTPQTFRYNLLKAAYEQPYHDGFTDDASVVESLGETITLIEGSYTNLKITYPEDIALAETIQKKLPR